MSQERKGKEKISIEVNELERRCIEVIEESIELSTKLVSLNYFIIDGNHQFLNPVQLKLLKQQSKVMQSYHDILIQRKKDFLQRLKHLES